MCLAPCIEEYMSGYVFGTLYRRIPCPKQHKQILKSLSILLAGKSEVEDNDNEPDNI